MYTLGQWIEVRRVDHVKFIGFSFSRGIYLANPRWRVFDANHRPDLKVFDPLVRDYHLAQNNFDRITILGDIIHASYHLIQGRQAVNQVSDRYNNAVDALYNRAIIAMNLIAGAAYQQVMEHYITGVSRPARTIRINRMVIKQNAGMVSAVDKIAVKQQVDNANASPAFQNAQLTAVKTGQISVITQNIPNEPFLLGNAAPAHLQGCFQDDGAGGWRLIEYCNSLPRNADVDVVFVDAYDQNDVQGRTYRAGQSYNGNIALRPIITVRLTPVVGGNGTHPTTLLHELGHALCSEGAHSTDVNNLMASGHSRSGLDQLSIGQEAWFCNNPYVN